MRIALKEKNLSWEPIFTNLREREHKRPEFLAMNPNGTVPVLRDGETLLYDSTVINEYLEEQYPKPSLTFPEPARRGMVRQWEDYGDANFLRPAENIFIHNKGWRQFQADELERFRQRILDSLAYVDKALAGKEYLTDRFTYGDISFAPRVIMLDELGIALPKEPVNVRAWIERLRQRPSLQNLER